MQATDLKKVILENLRNFRNGDLLHKAKAILNTLGYQSDKTVELSPNTPENFVETFGQVASLNADKALLKKWRTVDLIFQLTEDELNLAKVSNLRKDFDPKIYQSYLFIAIELEGDTYSRTKLVTITREVNKLFAMPVMLFFKSDNALTIAIINRRPNKRESSKDVLEKVTLIKDINLENPHRAHIEILFDLALPQLLQKHTISHFLDLHEAWQKTLDISELNKKFYRELSAWYFWAVRNVRFPDDAEKDEEVRNATGMIRLITRLIFIWFLKEKGQIPGQLFDETSLDKLLDYSDKTGSTYYKAILQNLFFATLNTEMNRDTPGSRKFVNGQYLVHTFYRYRRFFKDEEQALKLFEDIPFLNGGLFECLDRKDDDGNIIRIDCFSDNPKNEELLKVPDFLFWGAQKTIDLSDVYDDRRRSREKVRGLIHILNSYKFTVAENTPLEEEVALDPELLGKVFENLLAAYNPETKTTARKQTGSFYTPREIVNYMVDESLIAYLETKLVEYHEKQTTFGAETPPSQKEMFDKGKPQQTKLAEKRNKLSEEQKQMVNDRLRQLFSYSDDTNPFSEAETDALINAIDTCKILDPACGSGAFPMGILHRMVHLLGKLDPHNRKWKQKQVDKVLEIPDVEVREQLLQDIEQNFEENELDYGRKLYLIENCIYGVDIQPIACQIAKLRFFISLVVDQKVDRSHKNLGIRPLPNLETRFVAANTLIGIERPKQMSLRNPAIDAKEEELRKVRERHFTARTHRTKEKYRELDAKLRKELAELLREDGFRPEATNKLAQWNPYDQHASADFFDMEWMFGLSKGFDIVIGNPPYIKEYTFREAFESLRRSPYYMGKMDIWYFFACKGIDFLKEQTGVLTYIATNNWVTNYGAKILRNKIVNETQILKLIDFKNYMIFESSDIQTMIMVIRRQDSVDSYYFDYRKLPEEAESLSDVTQLLNGSDLNNKLVFKPKFQKKRYIDRYILFAPRQEERVLEKILSRENFRLLENGDKRKGILPEVGQGIVAPQDYLNREGLKRLKRNDVSFGDGIFFLTDLEYNSIAWNEKEKKLLRPLYTSSELQRYYAKQKNNFWVIYTGSDFNKRNLRNRNPKINIDDYPNIKAHLDKFAPIITSHNKPYGLHRSREQRLFEGEKIMALRKSFERPVFTYTDFPCYVSQSYNIIKSDRISLKYLTGLLNSTLIAFWLRFKGKMQGRNYQLDNEPLSQIPICKPSDPWPVVDLVERILISKVHDSEANTIDLENEIDLMVYRLYDLTYEEVKIVDPEFAMSAAEYEAFHCS